MTGKRRDNNISDQETGEQAEKKRICGLCIGILFASIAISAMIMGLGLKAMNLPEEYQFIVGVCGSVSLIAFLCVPYTAASMLVYKFMFPDREYLEITLESKISIFTPVRSVALFLDNVSNMTARLAGLTK